LKKLISDINAKNKDKLKSNPSYPIARALTEFAPGPILIDGLNYKSSGIIMKKLGQSTDRTTLQACKKLWLSANSRFWKSKRKFVKM
jgi:hypothetical protein